MQALHWDLIRGFGVRKALAFHTLYLNDEVVAVYYGFYEKEDAFFYLHGFDPDLSLWSPGVLLVGAAVEEAYKYPWGAEDRPNFLRWLRPTD